MGRSVNGGQTTARWVRRPVDCYRIVTTPVTRARGWRLYTRTGRRILDLTGGEGAALLGHRSAGARRRISAALDRGTTLPLAGAWPRRLATLLDDAVPAAPARAVSAPHALLLPLATDEGAAVVAGGNAEIVAFRLPLPFGEAPVLEFDAANPPSFDRLLELASQLGSGICAAMAAALVELQRASREPAERIAVARTFRTPERWYRLGVYLWNEHRSGDRAAWDAFRRRALAEGLLLPRFGMPIVLPGEVSRRERSIWEERIDDWPE